MKIENKEELIYAIKKYIYKDGNFAQQRTMKRILFSKFPQLKEYFKNINPIDYYKHLYMFIHKIDTIPKCEQCRVNDVKFKNFTEGFRRFCSNSCVNKSNSKSKDFSKKISKSMKEKYNSEYFLDKYGDIIDKNGEWFTKIDGTIISKGKHKRINESNFIDTKQYFIDNYSSFKFKTSETWVKDYFPKTYKLIIDKYENLDLDFNTKKYLFINNLDKLPKCEVCDTRPVIVKKYFGVGLRCNNQRCRNSSSIQENEIYQFIKKNYNDIIIQNWRDGNFEIDIFLPKLNLGFEVNGLYWHSEINKPKQYHQNKKLTFLEKGIDVIHIWEDDWISKPQIIKSIIKSKIGGSKKIGARKCTIKEIRRDEAKIFLLENHLQGYSISSINLGLFYKDVLVSVMTFGKSRMILKSKDKNFIELLRFANLNNYSVIGGASKLLNYFIKNFKPTVIISYASLDISNGNLYKKLGFKNVGITKPGYWWWKDRKKYHRSNFMKHKLVEMGFPKELTANQILTKMNYYRIWNSGNIKYQLEINK